MRSGLFLLFLAIPSAALAAEDRYGPARRPDPVLSASQPAAAPAREPSGYSGRMLTWSNKAAAPVVQPIASTAQPATPAPGQQTMVSAAPAAAAPNRLPTGIYDGPRTPVSAPAPAPGPAPQPTTSAPWQAPQATNAQPSAALPPPPVPQPIASPSMTTSAYSAPRAYSVVREYGGTPDRISPPPPQSAFTGREVTLDPGLLSEPREQEDRSEDEEDIEQPRKPAAKDRK